MRKIVLLLFFSIIWLLLQAQKGRVSPVVTDIWIQGDTVHVPGRILELNPMGFPVQITNFLTADGKDTTAVPVKLLAEGIHFHFTRLSDGKDIRLVAQGQGRVFTRHLPHLLSWSATAVSSELKMELGAELHSDASLSYTISVTALQDLQLKDITMHIPFEKEGEKVMRRLGQKEDQQFLLDSIYTWKWDKDSTKQLVWIGNANAGLIYNLDGVEWVNEGAGGFAVGVKGKSFLANNFNGVRTMKKGEKLEFDFGLAVTPILYTGGPEPAQLR